MKLPETKSWIYPAAVVVYLVALLVVLGIEGLRYEFISVKAETSIKVVLFLLAVVSAYALYKFEANLLGYIAIPILAIGFYLSLTTFSRLAPIVLFLVILVVKKYNQWFKIGFCL